jgi:outer membrane protein OmpA-like peptidoglycan-associated protein
VLFSKLSYNLDLREIEQPVITSPSSLIKGVPGSFDGLSSTYQGSKILNYTWDFGDGFKTEGSKINHEYGSTGDFTVKLGLIVRNEKTGVIQQACILKSLKVLGDKQSKTEFDARVARSTPKINIFDYDHALISDLYSVERDFNQDMVFGVEIASSKLGLNADNAVFKNVPARYTIRELYLPERKVYSYVVDEELNLMATSQTFSEMINLGYSNARVITYIPDNPAARELNNLKRVFGLSADNYFRKNDFSLTSAGTQMLDLILGLLSKYPNIRLELSAFTDNQGSASANLLLTQKRADAMVSYLVNNGVSPSRITGKGYGSAKPIAPNISEADRKLNRRIDFTIIKE